MDYLLAVESGAGEKTELDKLLLGRINELSAEEKEFIIHVINGLKLFTRSDGGEESVDNEP